MISKFKWQLVFALTLTVSLGTSLKASASPYANNAFNFIDYLAANPDLPAAGIITEYGAYQHWMNYGRYECRRSTSSFNPAVYLSLYPDLQNAFGQNCSAAINHWLNHGFYEGRIAILPNSPFGSKINGDPYFGNDMMTLSATRRTAGAIDSLTLRNKQFINAYDHGRQISIAWRNDTFVTGECDNPTEPGSQNDGTGYASTTQVLALETNMNGQLYSKVVPAFWTNPFQTTPDGCTTGPRLDGRLRADDQILEKTMQVGYKGDPFVIVNDIYIHNNKADVPSFQIEAPTAYLTYEFTRYHKLLSDGSVQDINILAEPRAYGPQAFYGGEQNEPVIISTPDGQYAMGAFSPGQYSVQPTYAYYHFPSSQPQVATNKWSVVFRLGRIYPGVFHFRSYIVVGNLEEVRQRLHWLRNGW